MLSAGERRAFTANTIIRDPAWRKLDPEGALCISPHDAVALGVTLEGGPAMGAAPNELTRAEDRDEFVGTPWHKYVPARMSRP